MTKTTTPVLTITDTRLVDAIQLVKHAAAKDEARPILHGVHFKAMRKRKTGPADAIRIEAADNYRIAHVTLPIEPVTDAYSVTPEFDLTIGLAEVGMLLQWLGKPKYGQPVTLTVLGNAVYAKRGEFELQLPRIEASFPRTDTLIDPKAKTADTGPAFKPPKKPYTIAVTGSLLADLLKALSDGPKGIVYLTFDAADPLYPIRATGDADDHAGETLMPVRGKTR